MTPDRSRERAPRPDPDRPLLRLLNRVRGAPVLVMTGRPGNHDPAHTAAGRLPVRFHKYSDLRLLWQEFPSEKYMGRSRDFSGVVLMTNVGVPLADLSIATIVAILVAAGRPALWGEAEPTGAVRWHPNFGFAWIVTCTGRRIDACRVIEAGREPSISLAELLDPFEIGRPLTEAEG